MMTKGKHSNKEATKPKQVTPPTVPKPEPTAAAALTPGAQAVASLRKKKW